MERERERERKKGNRDAVSLHMITIHSFMYANSRARNATQWLISKDGTHPPLQRTYVAPYILLSDLSSHNHIVFI